MLTENRQHKRFDYWWVNISQERTLSPCSLIHKSRLKQNKCECNNTQGTGDDKHRNAAVSDWSYINRFTDNDKIPWRYKRKEKLSPNDSIFNYTKMFRKIKLAIKTPSFSIYFAEIYFFVIWHIKQIVKYYNINIMASLSSELKCAQQV